MREQLEQYVKLLFAGTPDSEDMQQEILQNTLDRYDDLIEQGKSAEAAYRLAISGIGDVNELLGASSPAPAETENVDYRGRPLPSAKKKTMQAVAIGMYICCVVPVIALGNVGEGILGICMMFLLIAAATVLMVLSSTGKTNEKNEKNESTQPLTPQQELRQALQKTLSTVALVAFLAVSFLTGAWYITWLIFPIMGAVRGIVFACMDLKEAKEHET